MIPNSLQTIAEISIGLAGFSGLVVVLRKIPGPLTDVQEYRLRILFAMTFGTMFLSLLPDLLLNLGVPDNRIWLVSAAAMFVYSLIFVSGMITCARRVAKVAPEIIHWLIFVLFGSRSYCCSAPANRGHDGHYCRPCSGRIHSWPDLVPDACGTTVCAHAVHASQEPRTWLMQW